MARVSDDVKLIGLWPSPFVMRARIALNLKSVDYQFLQETFGVKSDLLLKSNPVYKKIPVLLHDDDKPICESLIILHYIDDTWTSGPSILPSDPYDRALARFWAYYIDDKLVSGLSNLRKAQGEESIAEALTKVMQELEQLEQAFKECSKGKAFFGGDRIGYVDITLGCFLAWFKVIEKMNGRKVLDEVKTPDLLRWAERFCADEAVKDVMPETDKLLEFARKLFSQQTNPPNSN